MEKSCIKCKTIKQLSEYNRNKSRKDGYQNICRKCSNATSRAYYKDNRSKHIKAIRKRNLQQIARNRTFVIEYLQTHPCVDCGEADIVVLQFDHQKNKKEIISKAVKNAWSIESLKNEIAKCLVRCANCHTRKTAKDFNWYKTQREVAQSVERLSDTQ